MAQLNPTDTLLERACDLLVQIAQMHVMSRRGPVIVALHNKGTRCGICDTPWPCRTYRLATGDIE